MSTKIFYNDNRIIIDGHADTEQECQAITAMCDSLANDENFKTIVYEKGHAVFEKISGGDTMMFEGTQTQLNELNAYVKTLPTRAQFTALEDRVTALIERVSALETQIAALEARIAALENKTTKTLPYTADQLIAKLENL